MVGENLAISLGQLDAADQLGDKEILLLSQVGSALIAGTITGDPEAVMIATTNAVTNNYLNHTQQKAYAKELEAQLLGCAGNIECFKTAKVEIDKSYQDISDTNNADLKAAVSACEVDQSQCQIVQNLINEATSTLNIQYAVIENIDTSLLGNIPPGVMTDLFDTINNTVVQDLLDRNLDQEVVIVEAVDAVPETYGPGTGFEGIEASVESAIDVDEQTVDQVVTTVVVASLFLPDPSDLIIGAANVTKFGQAVVKYADDGVTRILELAGGKKVKIGSEEYDNLFDKKVGGEVEGNLPNGSATTNVNSSRLKDDLIRVSERPLISDQELSKEFDKLYRSNATLGSGSTADAVRHELATGNSVGGVWHTQKAKDSIINLQKWVKKNPNANSNDISAAENAIRDLQNALNGN